MDPRRRTLPKRVIKLEQRNSSFIIEDEDTSNDKTSVIFEASLKKFIVILTNNSTSMPNKYSPANIKLYRDCQCAKCCPNLYEIPKKKLSTNDSFHSVREKNSEEFKSVGSGSEKSRRSSQEAEELMKSRKGTIENLKSIRKKILMIELIGLDFKISYIDKTLSHLEDIPLKIWNISIIDPYSLQRFYREAEEEKRFSEEILENIRNYKERFRKFYGYLYDKYRDEILVKNDKKKKEDEFKEINEDLLEKEKLNLRRRSSTELVVKRKNLKKFTFFINFLLFNGNSSLSEFLILLRKDKKTYDQLNLDELDKYNKFFEVESSYFLHFDAETRAKFTQIKSTGSKKKICNFNKFSSFFFIFGAF